MAVAGNLARYRTISRLGAGGMARVDLAEDTVLGREVALKRVTGSSDARSVSRLRREALTGASLSHPNLVSIYDVVSTEDGDLVIVMEYVPGETLRAALDRRGRIPPAEALGILDGVAAGLDAIHERGIVHRDVKPSNILLGPDGAVKLADLGIAADPDRTRITTSGSILGSLGYMAPEQLEDAPTTPAIDIYALAAVAYEMLSGSKARRERHAVALAHAMATQPPPDLRSAWPQAPVAAADVLRQGMARDPAQRPASAGELVARLRAALSEEETARLAAPPPQAAVAPAPRPAVAAPPPRPVVGAPPPRSRRGARGAVLAALALLAVAAAVVVAVVLAGGGSPSPRRPAHTTAARASHKPHRSPARSASRSATTASSSAAASSTSAAAAAPASSTSTAAPATSTSTAAPAAASPPPSGAGTPVAAVQSFYRLAASHQYSQAWAFADPTLQAQLEGYRSFVAGQQGDRSITFDSARTVSQTSTAATVAIRTTSVRDDGTHHCTGTVDLVPSGSAWRLHLVHISCAAHT